MAEIVEDEVSINIKAGAKQASEQVKNLANDMNHLGNVIKGLKSLGIGTMAVKALKSLAQMTQKTADYIETLNLFRVSMGSSADEAQRFIDKAERILGLDPEEMMQSISTLKNMSEGFGIASEKAYTMAQNLTQLAADMSSFANIPFSTALSKIQSGLAGEVKPLRQLGIALDQATLQERANALGIQTRVTEMTRAQKAQLAYYQIMISTQKMQGDLGRSLISPANSIRLLKTEFLRLARAIGSIAIPMLVKSIPLIRALTQVATEAAQALARMFGFEMSDYEYDIESATISLGDIGDEIGAIGDEAEGTTKKLNKMLMPFDELNNMSLNSGSSGSGGSGVGISGAGGDLGIPLPTYDMFSTATTEMLDKIQRIKERIESLLPIISSVAAGFAAWKISKGILDLIGGISGIDSAKLAFGIGLTVTGIVLEYQGMKKILNGDISIMSVLETFLGTAAGTFGIVTILRQTALGKSMTLGKQISFGLGIMIGISSIQTVLAGVKQGDVMKQILGAIGLGAAGLMVGASLGHPVIGLTIGLTIAITTEITAGLQKTLQDLTAVSSDVTNLAAKVNDSAQKSKLIKDNATATINQGMIEYGYVQKLVEELNMYVDANGRVLDSYKNRVSFILDKVNSTLGTEYELTDQRITQNGRLVESMDEIKGSIYDMIEAKKAQLLLEANEQVYLDAVQNRMKYYKEYQETLKKQKESYKELDEALRKYGLSINDYFDSSGNLLDAGLKELFSQNRVLTHALNNYEANLKNVSTAYNNYTDTLQVVRNYENLTTAVITGNKKEIEKGINDLIDKNNEYSSNIAYTVGEALKSREYQVVRYKDLSDEEKRILDANVQNAVNALVSETNAVKTLTPEQVEAWRRLASSDSDAYAKALSQVSEETRNAINSTVKVVDASKDPTIQRWAELAKSDSKAFVNEIKKLPAETQGQILAIVGKVEGTKDAVAQALYTIGDAGRKAYKAEMSKLPEETNQAFNNSSTWKQLKETAFQKGTEVGNNLKNGVTTGLEGLKQRISNLFPSSSPLSSSLARMTTSSLRSILGFADGGFPETGQLFLANEAGPELVGTIGRKTAVANSSQIITGIEAATYNAMSRAFAENRGSEERQPIIINFGNKELYRGYAQYRDEQSNILGVTI